MARFNPRSVSWMLALVLPLGIVAPAAQSAAEEPTKTPTSVVSKKSPSNAPAAKHSEPHIQVAILLDTSNSMDGLINQARAQLWKIINEFASARLNGKGPKLEVALYEYGNTRLPASEGYIRLVVPLSDNLDKISEELFALKTSGGDEFCGQVVHRAATTLNWNTSNAALKCIFIAGNEPFTQGQMDYREACSAATKNGITVNTIHCGSESAGISGKWQDAANLAGGSFMTINQNKTVVAVKAPQDKELARLSGDLNKTYVAYGAKDARDKAVARQEAQDKNAEDTNSGNVANRAHFKARAQYRNDSWDLVDACKNKKVKLEDLKKEQLPEALRKLSKEELKAHVEKLAKQRQSISDKIKALSSARAKYVTAERQKLAEKAGTDTLDAALINTVHDQAKKKNFEFEK